MDKQPTPPQPPETNDTPPVPQPGPASTSPQPPAAQQPTPQPQGYPTAYPQQPAGQKSKAPLIIGIVVGAIVLLVLIGLGIFAMIAALGNNDSKSSSSTNSGSSNSSRSDDSTSSSTSDTPKSALKATYPYDFKAVCDGTPISNAASYTNSASAKITSFYQTVLSSKIWTSTSAGYNKSYYVKTDTPISDISVVACLKPTSGKDSPSTSCELEGGTTIKYHSADYSITFYEAKTAKKISTGEPIKVSASECPMFVAYDKSTLKAYANPDSNSLEARLDTFAQ